MAKLEAVSGGKPAFADVAGPCNAATIDEISEQGWSLLCLRGGLLPYA